MRSFEVLWTKFWTLKGLSLFLNIYENGKKSRFFPWNRCMLLFHRIIIVALPETEVKRKFIPAKQFSQKNLVKSMWYVIVAVSFETSS